MKEMNERRKATFVFSTHDKMVMDYARRLILIRDGLVADDQVREGGI
jgi:putative ABC transport system ATP-binding protein